MKKIVLRSILIACILTGAVAFLVWWMSMRRVIPEHARVIPQDAFAVVTLNLRELAIDRSGDEHLYPEMQDESMMQKELEPFTKAIQANGAAGFEETADVLMFAYHSGESAFFGIAVQLEDSAIFGNLVRVHIAREYNIVPWTTSGVPIVRFDTTAAVIGWTEDVALFLYPIGHHGIETVSTQCIELLKQKRENSVLINENFCQQELKSFDMSLWVQTQPFMRFSGGGDLAQQAIGDIQYFSYLTDFTDGEILVRSEWYLEDEVIRDNIIDMPFPCESKDVLGFMRFHLDTERDSMFKYYADAPPLNELPLNDEECIELLPYLTGDVVTAIHDTITYTEEYTTYDYDKDFNRVEVKNSRDYTVVTHSTSYKVADKAKVAELIGRIMQRDSIPRSTNGWVWGGKALPSRLILSDDLLTVTNCPDVDGRGHAVAPEKAGYMAWFDLHRIFAQKDAGILSLFIPSIDAAYEQFSSQLVTLHSTLPVQSGNVRRSEIELTFKNEDINGLVQAEEILRKIYFSAR